jgi:predicted DCC family thiol-disulfide oxidoreductase YuxK
MLTAIFDGNCVICQATRRLVTALDWWRRVEWLDLHQWARVQARYPALAYDDAMGQIHVYDDARCYAGFLGTKRLLRALPLTFPIWLLLNVPGMTAVGARVYRFIARRRYAINRLFGVELCEEDVCKIG